MGEPPPLVEPSYVDAYRVRRQVAPEVQAGVLAAMGLAPGERPAGPGVIVGRPGATLSTSGQVIQEDGTDLGHLSALPPDIPFGYHRLIDGEGVGHLLLTGPGRCHLPPGLREWGWAVQLATTRSRASWGIGDLGDLRALAAWSASVGAAFVVVSPLGAPNPGPMPEPSPYYPSTRRFGNPLHVRVDEGIGDGALDELAAAGRALNAERRVDRARALRIKLEALERTRSAGRWDRAAFEAWRAEQGEPLERWATFAVLTEQLGPGWRSWPEAYRDPASPSVAGVAHEAADRIGFHAWVQWRFDRQLAQASEPLRRIADMPVGVDPGGFDAWDWQEQLAVAATVGAPPDRFNHAGQDWGLPPFIPHRLRDSGYRPFIETVRAQLRHAGGLRIDHVLGLFRLWWIPGGADPARGAYVRYPTDELLEIVAIESHRAGALVIGEDLGTVPPGVRRELRRRNLLSTRLVLFERVAPERYPRQSFAGITTHDLPTIVGALTGSDLDDQGAAGVKPDVAGLALLRGRLQRAAGVGPSAPVDDTVVALHRRLARSPTALVAATLEDALRVETRPNLPGTVAEQRPNWSIALPKPIEDLVEDRGVARLVAALSR
jgi:4-alpha-glucanotransferase